MLGLDDWIARLGGSGVMAFVVALLLGLRHATDPDHLTAVSTLFLGSQRDGPRRATRLGLAWGLGHGLTLFVFGLPVILFRRYLPDVFQRGAEAAIGLVIVALALRLLLRGGGVCGWWCFGARGRWGCCSAGGGATSTFIPTRTAACSMRIRTSTSMRRM